MLKTFSSLDLTFAKKKNKNKNKNKQKNKTKKQKQQPKKKNSYLDPHFGPTQTKVECPQFCFKFKRV